MVESPLSNVKLRLVESVADAADLMSWLGERHDGPLCFDTESGGLSAYRTRLRMVQFGDKNHGWAVPWERWGGVAQEVISSYEGEWAAHNLPHDWQHLMEHGGVTPPLHMTHDTLTLARLDDPARLNGLKPLSAKKVCKTATQGEKALHDAMSANKWTWDTVPVNFPPYWIYSALDPVLTAHLYADLAPRVAHIPDSYSLERAASRICMMMMRKGMLVDVPYTQNAIATFEAKVAEIRLWLDAAHGITSPKSGGQIRRALERLGQEIKFWTDKGAPQFDKTALSYYETFGVNGQVQQLVKYVRAVRHIEDIVGRYLGAFIEMRDANDVIHCNINVMGARTGRMSVSDPALQQLPRDDKMVRGSFIPRPGYVFVTCDLSQVEMRLLAHLSDDDGLVQAFHEADNGADDFFTAVASALFHEKITKKDPRRQLTKNSSYARAYGSGTENLAATAGVSIAEVNDFQNLFDQRFPGMKSLMTTIEGEAKAMQRRGERGGVTLESGRFLPCDAGKEYATLNYLIQGTAAEYMKVCLTRIDSAGYGDAMCLPVHDEVILEVPAGEAEEALRVVEQCMTDRENFRVPITAEGEILEERWRK